MILVHPIYETSHQMGDYPRIVIILMLGFCPVVGIGLIGLGIYTAFIGSIEGYPTWIILMFLLFVMSIAAFVLSLGWAFISGGLARYRFEADGLWVKYPLQSWQLISWDEFQEVCVIHTAFTTRGERRANTDICCVKKGEKRNMYGRWKDNPFRYHSVICIAYSPALYKGIKERCPYEVVDLRETRAYRLN